MWLVRFWKTSGSSDRGREQEERTLIFLFVNRIGMVHRASRGGRVNKTFIERAVVRMIPL